MNTNQEVFNFVYFALKKQGKRSFGEYTNSSKLNGDVKSVGCLYRGPDNCKCAAGHLIADDKYDPSFEGKNVFVIDDNCFSVDFRKVSIDLIGDMQVAHDNCDNGNFSNSLYLNFRIVADSYFLNMPE